MTNRYYVRYPRDFANEYDILVVPANDAPRLQRFLPDAQQILRRTAEYLGTTVPRAARRDGRYWPGGWLSTPWPENTDFLTPRQVASSATLLLLDQIEADEQEMAAIVAAEAERDRRAVEQEDREMAAQAERDTATALSGGMW